jgi:DNA-binding NarL/FixJ family response regulator
LINTIAHVEVVAEAGDGKQAVQLAREHSPDLVLMDISMKALNGIEATSQIRRESPKVQVIILSMHTGEEHVAYALQAGAAGYMIKDSATQELELAINAVMRGEAYLSPGISRQIVDGYVRRAGTAPTQVAQLSPRQREILQMIAEGRTTKEIAHSLKLSVKTVESHRTQIMERLEIYDVPGLVRYAVRVGLVTPYD